MSFIYTIFPLRLLPFTVQDVILDFFGVNKSMDEFVGKGENV